MRIAIAGGHGQIGGRLIRVLVARGDEVRSLDRNPDHADELREATAPSPVVCETSSRPRRAVAEGGPRATDAVVFAAGAGPGSGAERKGDDRLRRRGEADRRREDAGDPTAT